MEDGATVPIYYESRLPELRVEGETLDAVFERVFHDRSDKERTAIKNKFATLEAVAGAPRRIERIGLDLIEHFERFIHPNEFKAQVVACSRDAAVTYLETLERLGVPPVALIMSGSYDDPDRLARYHTTKEQRKALIERFKNTTDPLAINILKALEDLTVIDWARKDDIQREMRRRIKRQLRASGFSADRIEAMTAKIMDLARARLAR